MMNSCSTIGKLATGIRNPELYTSLEDRSNYYTDFIENINTTLEIRHYNHQDSLINGFNRLSGQELPILLARHIDLDTYYALSCFEDISADIESMNNNNYEDLLMAQDSTVSLVKKYLNETVVDMRLTPNYKPNGDKNFEIYYVGGIFLGNKIKKRVSDVAKIKDLRSVQLIELSMAEESQE